MSADPIMADIMAAIATFMRDRDSGELDAVWARIKDAPEPYHACVLSHYMADAQDNLQDELAWDIRALEAALQCTDVDARRSEGMPSVATFMPSLHLNLAQDYFKLGDLAQSRMHLETARALVGALSADGYGRMIRNRIERLSQQLREA